MSERVPTESMEQQWLFQWARLQEGAHPELRLLYHIPNEGLRSRSSGGRLVAEGLRSGVPDLCLPVARGRHHGLYIEMKRRKGGRVSENQWCWLTALQDEGYLCRVCRGWEEAKDEIVRYLNADSKG